MPETDLSSELSSLTDSSWFNFEPSNDDQNSVIVDGIESEKTPIELQQSDNTNSTEVQRSNQTEVQHSEQPQTVRIYQLAWATRDAIILNLNRYSQLFCGEKADDETKKKLANDNMNLYRILASLPPKSTDPSDHSNKVALELGLNDRLSIVSTLFANQALLVDPDYCSEDRKRKMVEYNNEVIFELLKLSISVSIESSKETASKDKTERVTEESKLAGEVASLKRILETKQSELTGQVRRNGVLSENVKRLEKEIKRIKEVDRLAEVTKMFSGKLDLGVNRKKVEFEYELNGVDAFLESNKFRRSEFFFANHLAWHLKVKTKADGENRFLSIFLCAHNHATIGNWSTKATYDLIILNQSGGKNKSSKSTKDFGTGTSFGWGVPKFISLNDLRTGGYIKEDKIKVQILLEVEDLVRSGLSKPSFDRSH